MEKISHPECVDSLISVLNSNIDEIEVGAMKALGEIGDQKALNPLLSKLDSQKWNIRRYAINSLAKIQDSSTDIFINALRDDDVHVREKAVEMIGKHGDDITINYLRRVINDEDEDVRDRAQNILNFKFPIHEPITVESKPKHKWGHKQSLYDIIDRIGQKEASKILIEFLSDDDPEIRQRSCEVLGEIQEKSAVKHLIQLLKDEDSSVKWRSREALRKIGKPAVMPLIQALNNGNPQIRKRVACALGEIGDEQAIQPLISRLDDENDVVRLRIVTSISRFGKKAMEPLIVALDNENYMVREKAAQALGEIGDPMALDYLKKALNDEDPTVQRSAAKGIKTIIADKASV
jgi:HEAT repeat protein